MAADIKAVDAVLVEALNTKVNETINREAPAFQELMNAGKKVTVNEKGYESVFAGEALIAMQGGSPDDEWASGAEFEYFRDKVYAVHTQTGYEVGYEKFLQYSNGDKNTLVKMTDEIDKVQEEFIRIHETYVVGDGTGALAWINTQANGSSTTVFSFLTTPDGTHAKDYGHFFIKKNTKYDLVDPSDAVTPVKSVVTFSAVDKLNNTATVATATVSITNGMLANPLILCMPGTYNNVPKGLVYGYAVNKTGVFQNHDLTGNPERNTPGVNAAGKTISNAILRTARQKHLMRHQGTAKSFKLMTSPAQLEILEAKAEGLFRFTQGAKTYDTSVSDVRYKEYSFVESKHFGADRMIGCDTSMHVIVERDKLGVLKGPDGLVWHPKYGANQIKGVWHMNVGAFYGIGYTQPENGLHIYNLDTKGTVTLANSRETSLPAL